MKKVFTISLAIYTILIGLLIPITLFLKTSSFNKDYYPTSFILFLSHLGITLISLIIFQFIKDPTSLLKQTFRYISIILILIDVIFQIIWSFDLFKESISSTADMVGFVLYIFLGLTGFFSILELLSTAKKANVDLNINA